MNRKERLERDGAVDPILFYDKHDKWGEFSNFSFHGVQLPNPWKPFPTLLMYKSGEHRYQALKATTEQEHDWVVSASGPAEAKGRGNEVELVPDWGDKFGDRCWWVMLETVTHKAIQHDDVMNTLIATDDKWIYEDSRVDDIWGWRHYHSYNGKNLLGLAWMHARASLLDY